MCMIEINVLFCIIIPIMCDRRNILHHFLKRKRSGEKSRTVPAYLNKPPPIIRVFLCEGNQQTLHVSGLHLLLFDVKLLNSNNLNK